MKRTIIGIATVFGILLASGGGMGGFNVGVIMPDVEKFNAAFPGDAGIETPLITTGGGGWGKIGRVVIGGYGAGGSRSFAYDTDSGKVNVEVDVGYGYFEPGYELLRIGGLFSTQVLLGFGGFGVDITMVPERYGNLDFEDIVENPERISKVSMAALSLQPALRMVVNFKFINLIMKGGYMLNVNEKWKLQNGGNVIDPPDASFSGANLTFGIYFGRWER